MSNEPNTATETTNDNGATTLKDADMITTATKTRKKPGRPAKGGAKSADKKSAKAQLERLREQIARLSARIGDKEREVAVENNPELQGYVSRLKNLRADRGFEARVLGQNTKALATLEGKVRDKQSEISERKKALRVIDDAIAALERRIDKAKAAVTAKTAKPAEA